VETPFATAKDNLLLLFNKRKQLSRKASTDLVEQLKDNVVDYLSICLTSEDASLANGSE
jgi:hypothetical protein